MIERKEKREKITHIKQRTNNLNPQISQWKQRDTLRISGRNVLDFSEIRDQTSPNMFVKRQKKSPRIKSTLNMFIVLLHTRGTDTFSTSLTPSMEWHTFRRNFSCN